MHKTSVILALVILRRSDTVSYLLPLFADEMVALRVVALGLLLTGAAASNASASGNTTTAAPGGGGGNGTTTAAGGATTTPAGGATTTAICCSGDVIYSCNGDEWESDVCSGGCVRAALATGALMMAVMPKLL